MGWVMGEQEWGGGGSHGCLILNEIRSSDQMASITKQTLNATKNSSQAIQTADDSIQHNQENPIFLP